VITPTVPSLDGKVFADVTEDRAGDVGAETLFEYHQEGDLVWARYAGGAVRLGYLVGTRDGDALDFRYAHVSVHGETAAGICRSRLSMDDDGAILSRESWTWESRPGRGTSLLREVRAG
jgi:hypothetical protein